MCNYYHIIKVITHSACRCRQDMKIVYANFNSYDKASRSKCKNKEYDIRMLG
jgi:hypothetical protein